MKTNRAKNSEPVTMATATRRGWLKTAGIVAAAAALPHKAAAADAAPAM